MRTAWAEVVTPDHAYVRRLLARSSRAMSAASLVHEWRRISTVWISTRHPLYCLHRRLPPRNAKSWRYCSCRKLRAWVLDLSTAASGRPRRPGQPCLLAHSALPTTVHSPLHPARCPPESSQRGWGAVPVRYTAGAEAGAGPARLPQRTQRRWRRWAVPRSGRGLPSRHPSSLI